ncbi:hypothetical protein HPB51_010017 [Rhipicephalus microplus]|uniref:Uncharacterized protein n=1 Tax=Rhipicephalus microplus TaxID=6941 RepID=A0A9J6DTG9_RHIMP|nr:hypothetical protein HPB51_010017 [Rhipicephalus microplus]
MTAKTSVSVGYFVRVKKSKISAMGDLAFGHPQKVVHQQGPYTFRLDDGRTWNDSMLSNVPAPSGTWNPYQMLPLNLQPRLRHLSDPRIAPQCAVPKLHQIRPGYKQHCQLN